MTEPATSAAAAEIERLMSLHPKGIDLSLTRITSLLAALGSPHLKMPPVIHIAGTNGKGSATAFCRALLESAGYAVHVDTSPHLVNWHERYRLGVKGGRGRLVSDAALYDAIVRVRDVNDGRPVTIFELLTAVGFLLFAEQPADAVILEVGLGGRFDSTNVIDDPAVSVIMPVSLDHQSYLGDSVDRIAGEKAGIIKRGRPVVVGRQEFPEALEVIVSQAERLGCPLSVYGQDFSAHEEHGRLIYQDEHGLADLPLPRLPGRHQYANAAAAIRAVRAAGFAIADSAVEKAMTQVEWPARLQRLNRGRLVEAAPADAEIWLDGGHNPGAGVVIAEAMAAFEESRPRPLYIVAGMINTKDQVGYFRPFAGLARHVHTVRIRGSDAALDPVVLADAAAEAGLAASPAESIFAALADIKRRMRDDEPPPRILIGGSLYFAGNALADNGTPPD